MATQMQLESHFSGALVREAHSGAPWENVVNYSSKKIW